MTCPVRGRELVVIIQNEKLKKFKKNKIFCNRAFASCL